MDENKLKELFNVESSNIQIKTTSEMIMNKFLNQEVDSFNVSKKNLHFFKLKLFLSAAAAVAIVGITIGSYFIGNSNLNLNNDNITSEFTSDVATETILQVYSAASLISTNSSMYSTTTNALAKKYLPNYDSYETKSYGDNYKKDISEETFTKIAKNYHLVNEAVDTTLSLENTNSSINVNKGNYHNHNNTNEYIYQADLSKIGDGNNEFYFTTYSNSQNNNVYVDGEIKNNDGEVFQCNGYIYEESEDYYRPEEPGYHGHPIDGYEISDQKPFDIECEKRSYLDLNVYVDEKTYVNITTAENYNGTSYSYTLYDEDEEIYNIDICYVNNDFGPRSNYHRTQTAYIEYNSSSENIIYLVELSDENSENIIEFIYDNFYGIFKRTELVDSIEYRYRTMSNGWYVTTF